MPHSRTNKCCSSVPRFPRRVSSPQLQDDVDEEMLADPPAAAAQQAPAEPPPILPQQPRLAPIFAAPPVPQAAVQPAEAAVQPPETIGVEAGAPAASPAQAGPSAPARQRRALHLSLRPCRAPPPPRIAAARAARNLAPAARRRRSPRPPALRLARTIRTAAACSTFLSNAFLSRRTAHECRSHSTCSARRRPTRLLVRTGESRGPPRE